MKVTTAIIFASGYGSRMLPVTAAIQKELLPILDRPVIDYVVSDCIAAGISRFLFVTRPEHTALKDYYLGNSDLEAHLARFGKTEALATLNAIQNRATYEFIEQPDGIGYGTAIPVQAAAKHLSDDEAFVVCGGDDFLWRTDGRSDTAELIATFTKSDCAGALMTLERPADELHRYGVLAIKKVGDREYLDHIVEKPSAGQAPSRLINISKYVLTPQLLAYIMQVEPDKKSGEYYIIDAITAAARHHPIAVHRAKGQFLDAGNLEGWLKANLTLAAARPELVPTLNINKKSH